MVERVAGGESVQGALATLREDARRLGPLTGVRVSEVWRKAGWYLVTTGLWRDDPAMEYPVRIAFAPRFGCHDHATEFRLAAIDVLAEAFG